jgi:hypothetical protein
MKKFKNSNNNKYFVDDKLKIKDKKEVNYFNEKYKILERDQINEQKYQEPALVLQATCRKA